MILKAPFPYFGGKSAAAPIVWPHFGKVDHYVEPFCGSLAMLLGAPKQKRVETVNDWCGFICNFWRSIKQDPEATAHWADWPVIENDLEARHSWLVRHADKLKIALNDPEYYNAKVAGWWVWGVCAWIGAGWCAGKGPWVFQDGALVDSRLLDKQLVHLSVGQGIKRQLVHLSNAGKGIQKSTDGLSRSEFILRWFDALSLRLRDVRIACGDWTRVCTEAVTTSHGMTAVFLDPPYDAPDMDNNLYGKSDSVNAAVTEWCKENGGHPLLRIALCGYEGEYDLPGWSVEKGKATNAGYSGDIANSRRERIWYSPHCLASKRPSFSFGV